MIAGHEPCGQIVKAGPGCRRFDEGDRVIVYHISGCGLCNDCRRGYMISCTSARTGARTAGSATAAWRDFLLAEEKDLIALPDELTYADGAQVACGFGTVYEGLEKIGISGNDAVLITGLGPGRPGDGGALPQAGRRTRSSASTSCPSGSRWRRTSASATRCCRPGPTTSRQVRDLTGGRGVERAVDCSANDEARATAIRATRKWGRIVFLGEGGTVEFNPSPDIIHDQKTIYGSWVTSTWLMEELVERLVRWNLHPADLVTHRFPLERVADAYALMASGRCGKVAVCFDEELR